MKREGSEFAIECNPLNGPTFGNYLADISIVNNCNKGNNCFIHNDDTRGYKCHPKYRSSLFVNTAGPDEDNKFSVLDYEVYTHN